MTRRNTSARQVSPTGFSVLFDELVIALDTLLKNNLARKLNRVYSADVICEQEMVPTFNPVHKPISAEHEHVYRFLYHLESPEKIQGSRVSASSKHGKSGQRQRTRSLNTDTSRSLIAELRKQHLLTMLKGINARR